MRHAFMLLGVMTLIVSSGAFIALKEVKAPEGIPEEVTQSETIPMTFSLTSPSFVEGGSIPSKFTCDGENISPELRIENAPPGTVSFVLVMDDPDIPDSVKQARGIEKFNHWAVYNIPGDTTVLGEGQVIGTQGLNSRGEAAYAGACPPDREHRYFFRLYALSGTLNFIKAPTLDELEAAAQSMMLGKATLMGRYERTGVTQ